METLLLIYIAFAILGIIMVVQFFGIAANIRRISEKLNPDPMEAYEREFLLKNHEKAANYLKLRIHKIVLEKHNEAKGVVESKTLFAESLTAIKNKYKPLLEEVGSTWDFDFTRLESELTR